MADYPFNPDRFCCSGCIFSDSVLLSNWAIRPVALAWKQQQFIADASQELKTPLTVILSNTGMILQTPECEISEHTIAENQNRTQRIHEEAIRMKHLVESLLFLARSDSGQIPAAFRNFDLSYIINSSILAFEPVAFELGKEIRSQIENSIQLLGDDTRIRQLADILLDNACKYSADNTAITVRLTAANAKEALLTVTSEGTPLSAYDIQHIFLRFYRADPSRSETSGHGLGLPIAQSIVKEHGGKIQVKSDGLQSNTFSVILPRLNADFSHNCLWQTQFSIDLRKSDKHLLPAALQISFCL